MGPYEVYEDGWLIPKAAFEAYITLKDKPSGQAQHFARSLQEIEDNLPIDAKNLPSSGQWHPSASSTRSSCPAMATEVSRLPPSICPTTNASIQEKGAKRVMLRNIQQAKFDRVLLKPISRIALFESGPEECVFRRLLHGHLDA